MTATVKALVEFVFPTSPKPLSIITPLVSYLQFSEAMTTPSRFSTEQGLQETATQKRFLEKCWKTITLVLLLFFGEFAFGQTPSPTPEPSPFQRSLALLRALEPSDRCTDRDSQDLIESYQKLETVNQNVHDGVHDTILHLTIRRNCLQATEWLLKRGADWRIRNKEGLNAFDLAVRLARNETLAVFLTKLSGAPVKMSFAKNWVSLSQQNNQKKATIDVQLGFSISNVSNQQIINLNSEFNGSYRYTPKTVLLGRAEVFFAKAERNVTSFRYLVEGKVVREGLFSENWNGALNLKTEGYPDLHTVDVAAMVDRTWKLFNNNLMLNLAAGPGVRYVDKTGVETRVEPVGEVHQKMEWKPQLNIGPIKAGQYTIEDEWTYTAGPSGYTSVLEVSAKHKLQKNFEAGIAYKHWNYTIASRDIDDNQILFVISYDTE